MEFENLCKYLNEYITEGNFQLTTEKAQNLFCRDCEFYKEDEKDYQCGAFKLLVLLLNKKILSLKDLQNAVRDE